MTQTCQLCFVTIWLITQIAFASETSKPGITARQLSGIYPHLAMFNDEGECGTGAVVPWADRLWVVTYAPHSPMGSTDKLYEIMPDLQQIVRPESIGGTPANRMIHRESHQLFIGPYAISEKRNVRAIPFQTMFGRPTGNARHLTAPADRIYYATMEEGLYEVDVKTLAVTELWADEQKKTGRHANLPGYHGKGLYSSQGRIIYANNGEHGAAALKRPDVPSGVLAEWNGQADTWSIVRRNQFTEVTGPGGITGEGPADAPVWSIGWDHRSLILMCLHDGRWHSYRLPKASHSYDGAHGWNTEWPRIRDVGEDSLLMTMHGMFWKFPRTFTPANSIGIVPRSTYLKVIGDFCRWQDRIVLGCDDTARNEFLNKRKAKGEIAAPQSQSNLWFVEPAQLDRLGPVIGRGAAWLNDEVAAGSPSEPFLFSGFERRALQLAHETDTTVTIALEVDERGSGQWQRLRDITLTPRGSQWLDLSATPPAAWIRLTSSVAIKCATAWFSFSNPDNRSEHADTIFDGLATANDEMLTGGIVRARGQNKRTLHFAAISPSEDGPRDLGLYELDDKLQLRRSDDAAAHDYQKQHASIPVGVLATDSASLIFIDDQERRWRLPRGTSIWDHEKLLGPSRVCREVATERDLFNAAGTFFELPAENAGGFAKVRAVATHNRRISDYCSYRGLFVMSGIRSDVRSNNPHILKSDDGRAALWAGAIDDVWKLGKPRGTGGPWMNTPVTSDNPSDPYLMTGYDRKTLTLSHDSDRPVKFRVECDIAGTGLWITYRDFEVAPRDVVTHEFPTAYAAYWLQITAGSDCHATAQLVYK